VQNILDWRGDISSEQFAAARAAGLMDAEIAEVVGHVALTSLTNYFNQLTQADVDFPRVSPNLEPASALQA
jgi:alkylhydroperoxidase family enzyme